jgi:hypothetical protein
LRNEHRAKRGPLPMFDRGPYFEEMKRKNAIERPEGWGDPDEGWFAADIVAEAAE